MNEAVRRLLHPGTIHLQGLGEVPAIPARDLKPGMLVSWNQSWQEYRIVSVAEASPRFLEVVEERIADGHRYARRMAKDRLVAAAFPKA